MKLILILILLYKMIKSEDVKLSINIMLQPMCEARCLDILRKETTTLNTSSLLNQKIPSYNIGKYCTIDNKCSGCYTACKVAKKSIDKCMSSCDGYPTQNQQLKEKQQSCIDSCQFIEMYRQNRPGNCPTISQDDSRSKNKIKQQCSSYQCSQDSDCYKIGTKCCHTKVNCYKNTRNLKMCLIADPPSKNVPPVPSIVNIKQINCQNQTEICLDIDWSSYPLKSLKYSVIFEIQMRTEITNNRYNKAYSSWTHIHTTPNPGLILRELILDKTFQFRVIAFSRYGSLNKARSTKPITIDYTPTNIPAPDNIRELLTRIETQQQTSSVLSQNNLILHHQQEVDVFVTLKWDLQKQKKKLLVPISLFKISWRKFYSDSKNIPLVKLYTSFVSGTRNNYTIKELKPSTTYEVKIQSIINYRNTRYNSTETSYFITTVPFILRSLSPPSTDFNLYNKVKPTNKENNRCLCQGFNAETPIKFEKFLLANDNLVYIVSLKDHAVVENLLQKQKKSLRLQDNVIFKLKWHPTACIATNYRIDERTEEVDKSKKSNVIYLTKKSNYKSSLDNLDFRCNYWLEIEMSFSDNTRKPKVNGPILSSWKSCFCTPNCPKEITALPPNNKCYQDDMFTYKSKRPPAPMNIRANIVSPSKSNKSLSSNKNTGQVSIEWTIDPSYEKSDSKFRITWAPRLPEPLDESLYGGDLLPIMDMAKANCKIIKFPQKSVTLSDLTPSLIYVVKVETIFNEFNSEPMSIYFRYPSKYSNYKNSSSSINNKLASIYFLYLKIIIIIMLFDIVTCRF